MRQFGASGTEGLNCNKVSEFFCVSVMNVMRKNFKVLCPKFEFRDLFVGKIEYFNRMLKFSVSFLTWLKFYVDMCAN